MDAFLGQLLLVPYSFAPYRWAFCAGQVMAISSNTALFSLLGTYYGGDGKSTFALPDMRGRLALGMGQGTGLSIYNIGESGGTETVTLQKTEIPSHNHNLMASSSRADQAAPGNNALADAVNNSGGAINIYASAAPNTPMNALDLAMTGGNQAHNNIMGYQALNWVIALQGIFPARN